MTTSTTYSPGQSVLIVDDNKFFAERMRAMLDDIEQIDSIVIAGGYNEATRLLEEKMPAVVLLDINMPPGKNGISLLKKIKQADGSCRVIMITNHIEECYRVQCDQLGADYFLDKSNDFGRVPSIVSEMLS